jgi:hypothetical protein
VRRATRLLAVFTFLAGTAGAVHLITDSRPPASAAPAPAAG